MIKELYSGLTKRPISGISAVFASMMIVVSLYEIASGSLYVGALNYVDATTLVMAGTLWLRVVIKTMAATDLQSVALALVAVVSFVFAYEAIYKYSFYLVPWNIPPSELRELIIQIAMALVVLSGFAFGWFSFSKTSMAFTVLFVALWMLWILLGYPQIFNLGGTYPGYLGGSLSYYQVYAINRATKLLLMMVYFFFPLALTRPSHPV